MLQDEDGPFAIFTRLQAWVAKRPDTVGGIQQGFNCFYCLSVWVAIPFALYLSNNLAEFFILLLALSGGAVLLHYISDKEEE